MYFLDMVISLGSIYCSQETLHLDFLCCIHVFSVPGTFTFGSLSAPDTSKADTKKDVTASKAFVFTPLALATTKGNIGFNFATASSGTGSVDQISIPGAAGGDSLTKSTSIGEDRKSPVSVDTKTGTGFNIRENAGMKAVGKFNFDFH